MHLKRVVRYDGKTTYEVNVAGLVRRLPIVPINTVTINGKKYSAYIASDAELMLGDTEFITATAKELAKLINSYEPEVLVAPEVKAVALTYELSRTLGLSRFIIIRKDIKAYIKDYLMTTTESITTAKTQSLILDGESIKYLRDRRVCIVDDVASTGNTLRAIESLMNRAGAIVACRAVIWLEGPWLDDDFAVHIGELPIFID